MFNIWYDQANYANRHSEIIYFNILVPPSYTDQSEALGDVSPYHPENMSDPKYVC